MNKITDTELQRLIELENAATPAPWSKSGDAVDGPNSFIAVRLAPNDAALIAALRNAAPALLSEIVRFRTVLDAAKIALTEKYSIAVNEVLAEINLIENEGDRE